MESLYDKMNIYLRNTSDDLQRYLHRTVRWSDRLIGVKGARGVGKTTLLLQHIKHLQKQHKQVLYVSLDDIYFQANTLSELAAQFYNQGGTHLYLDEVHKYPNWSLEIKNLYDLYKDMHIVFTGSSALEIYRGDADLSRRAVSYNLQGLSFREYLFLTQGIAIKTYGIDELLKDHKKIAQEITKKIKILPLFKKYLEHGYYPFFLEGLESYHRKLSTVINLIIEIDMPAIYQTEYQTVNKLKKLMYILANALPYIPNITKLSTALETTSRSSTLKYLHYLQSANLSAHLLTSGKGNNIMTKPDKIYLDNTNLMHALGFNIEIGTIRETFLFNQLRSIAKVNTSKESDFLVNDSYTIEVGGKNKSDKQIKGVKNAYIASDDIEVGLGNRIPLWLFGMMY